MLGIALKTKPPASRTPLPLGTIRRQWLMTAVLALAAWPLCQTAFADETTVTVGVLAFGTVNWELDVAAEHELATRHGIALEVVPLASNNALGVALQGDAVDVIVSDWIWVSRQRALGQGYTFFPYSLAVGALMVRPDAGIASVDDLRGKRLGVAGGPVGKSWLLLRAYTKAAAGVDLAEIVEPNFGAPPLLNQLMLRGELPAVINFWHYGARLEAAGMSPLLSVDAVLPALGIEQPIPLLGWVFDETWAQNNPDLVKGFLATSYEAKSILDQSDAEWERIRPLTKAEDDATFEALREAYRQGIPRRFGEAEIASAGKAFQVLAREGGPTLVGDNTEIEPGTFWSGFSIDP